MSFLDFLAQQKYISEQQQRQKQQQIQALSPLLGQQTFPQAGPVRPGETLPNITAQTAEGMASPQARTLQGLLQAGYVDPVAKTLLSQVQGPEAPFGGTGMDAQTYNQLLSYTQKKQGGIPTTPQEDLTYNLAYQRAGRPERFVTPSGQMIERPGINLSMFPAPPGLSAQERGLGTKPKSAETAGKMAMMDTARESLSIIKPLLYDEYGKPNKKAIEGMWAINRFEPAAAFVGPEGQQMAQAYEIVSQAITRTETGAAMQKDEIANTKQRFMPKPWDSPKVVEQKWNALNIFVQNAEKYLKPDEQGQVKVDFDRIMRDAKQAPAQPAPQTPKGPWSNY